MVHTSCFKGYQIMIYILISVVRLNFFTFLVYIEIKSQTTLSTAFVQDCGICSMLQILTKNWQYLLFSISKPFMSF